MRQIGALDKASEAQRFCAYLLTQGIDAQAEQAGDAWEIWVRDENQLDAADEELKQFKVDPEAPKYASAVKQAEGIERERAKKLAAARKNMVNIQSTWGRAMPGQGPKKCPLTVAIIAVSVVIFVAHITDIGGFFYRHLEFADRIQFVDRLVENEDGDLMKVAALNPDSVSDRLVNIRQGEVWRLLTPTLLHYDFLHIFFNAYMMYYLGGQVENYYGRWRYGLLVVALGLTAVLVQCLMPAELPLGIPGGSAFGGGLSGVVFGLFGFMWVKMNTQPSAGFFMSPFLIVIMFGQFFLGITGILDSIIQTNIAHWAHGGGLIAGIVIAYIHAQLRR